jgi:sugar/nucleoside kinase (ribokinase family)
LDASEVVWVEQARHVEHDVIGLGENSLDRLVSLAEFPCAGGKTEGVDLGTYPGGQVAGAILGCAKLGLRCAYLGVVGEDAAAEEALSPLRRAGVNLGGVVRRRDAQTRTAIIFVRESDGERSVLVQRAPELDASEQDFSVQALERARLLHMDATDLDLALWAARQADRVGVPISLDLDEAVPGVESLLERVQFPVVSRLFAEAWGGGKGIEAGLERIAESRACRLAVATREGEGALALWQGHWVQSPGFAVDVLDSTGAGDAFRAGFIWGLLGGQGVHQILRTANAVAALSCQAVGAQSGLPDQTRLSSWLATR